MPSRYRIKEYTTGGYYHIYNSGLDNRVVFADDADYKMFETLLARYLGENTNIEGPYKNEKPSIIKKRESMSLRGEVKLLAYCLMPDHYHLLIQQKSMEGITKLVRRVMTGYGMYYNRKNRRSGPLFENVYRAVSLTCDKQVLAVGRLIHLNPSRLEKRRFGLVETVTGTSPADYQYSSFRSYLALNDKDWVTRVYGHMSVNEYRRYVESPRSEADYEFKDLMIDE
ncbi:MAG: transposase [Patescibacteria group bacterium]